MAESIATPSSLSLAANSGTPTRGQERSEDFYLALSNQPSSFVFPDEPFEVAFTLESRKVSNTSSPPTDIRILVSLDSVEGDGMRLIVLEEPRLSLSKRSGRTKCCITRSASAGKERLRAKLRFSATRIEGCVTHYITLVRAKLKVSVGDDWTNVWYKDEGGRDKSIEIIVSAFDAQNNLLREPLQVDIKLCYDARDAPAVSNQDILKRLGSDRRLQIDPETGKAKIRFRVEDVSKNHQGQNFVLMIHVLRTTGASVDIAPAMTPPVNVRSKRNKRSRIGSLRGSSQDPSQTESAAGMQFPPSADRGFINNEQVREAMQDVIQWSEEVVNGMYHIQWRVMGYASNADGSIDYSRPYHNMQNPNPVVDRLLALYNQSTRENIRFLQEAVLDPPPPAHPTPIDQYPVTRSPVMPHPSMMSPPGVPPPPLPPPPPPLVDQYSMPGPSLSGMSLRTPEPYAEVPMQQYPHHPRHPDFYPHPSGKGPHHELIEPHPLAPDPSLDVETEVEYVLARQYKSLRTGQRLGFPAYAVDREILGFFRDSSRNAGLRQFIPISDQDFGPSEKFQAKKILEEAIASNSRAVQSVKQCGSIAAVLDRCLVYDFSKDIGGPGST